MMNAAAAIGRIRLFSALSPLAQHVLSEVAATRRYEDGQVIILEGDADAPVFFVLRGTVRVYRTNLDGREQNLIHLHTGDAFNMPAAFAASGLSHASAVAVGPVELLSIPCSDFRRVVVETPEIALSVLRDFSQKLAHLTELSHDLGLRSVRARLARFLLAHAASGEAGMTRARWTHEQIATQIGTVREVVSRAMRAFAKEGMVEVQRHQIVILDRERLAREADS
jgi:CRP/FNR family cyclic AMP-dependent transcriptional regulator